MVRVLTLVAIICVCCIVYTPTEARSFRRRTPKTTTPTPETTISATQDEDVVSPSAEEVKRLHSLKPRVLEQVDRRYLDGNFEYKYVLSNGVSRHEKSYWTPVGSSKVLARKGYYSYPLTNHKYLTVFYTADENGYHEDSSTYSNEVPVLPRNLHVPEYEFPTVTSSTSTTTRRPKATSKSSTTTKHF